MNQFSSIRALSLLLASVFVAQNAAADEPIFSTLEKQPFLRIGTSTRSIGVDFQLNSSSILPFGMTSSLGMGLGDVGFFTATSGTITYENGSVGPASTDPGLADAVIDDEAQITSTGRIFGGAPPGPVVDQASFQTTSTSSLGSSNRIGGRLSLSDEEVVTGPYLDLVFPLKEEEGKFKNAVIGYRYYEASLGHGPQWVGDQTLSTSTTTYNYAYDYLAFGIVPTSFPFSTSGIVFDAEAYDDDVDDFDGGLEEPRFSSETENTFTALQVITQSSLDLEFHEIPIGFECGREFGDTKVSLTGGVTLNLLESSFTSRSYFYQNGLSNLAYSRVSTASESDFKVGAYTGINVTHPLNDDGTWLLNFHASYRWVDSIHMRNEDMSAVIDLSSFEGGIGVVVFLD